MRGVDAKKKKKSIYQFALVNGIEDVRASSSTAKSDNSQSPQPRGRIERHLLSISLSLSNKKEIDFFLARLY